ncbi:MAG: hypothetical protein DRK00_05370 [Thermoprotei archaeon]|nr:MAG: hypothetical protein DRK00_05370 [Thermoprotei archaeon]
MGGYLTASLIWLFSLAVFIPLAAEVSVDAPLKPLIASMFLAATAIEVYGATAGALEYLNSQHVPERLRPILLEAVLAADAVLLVPLLWAVAPVLGGVGLILALTAMLVTAFPHLDELAAFVGRALINLARLLSAQ